MNVSAPVAFGPFCGFRVWSWPPRQGPKTLLLQCHFAAVFSVTWAEGSSRIFRNISNLPVQVVDGCSDLLLPRGLGGSCFRFPPPPLDLGGVRLPCALVFRIFHYHLEYVWLPVVHLLRRFALFRVSLAPGLSCVSFTTIQSDSGFLALICFVSFSTSHLVQSESGSRALCHIFHYNLE